MNGIIVYKYQVAMNRADTEQNNCSIHIQTRRTHTPYYCIVVVSKPIQASIHLSIHYIRSIVNWIHAVSVSECRFALLEQRVYNVLQLLRACYTANNSKFNRITNYSANTTILLEVCGSWITLVVYNSQFDDYGSSFFIIYRAFTRVLYFASDYWELWFSSRMNVQETFLK